MHEDIPTAVLRDGRAIHFRAVSTDGGLIVIKTHTLVALGVYRRPIVSGEAVVSMERFADQLEASGA